MHPSVIIHARPRSWNKKSAPKCADSGLSQRVVHVQSVPSSRQTPDGPKPPSWQIASLAVVQVSRHVEVRGEDRSGGNGASAASASASVAAKFVLATTSPADHVGIANELVQMNARHARSSEEADIGRFSSGAAPKGDSERSTRCVRRAGLLLLGLAFGGRTLFRREKWAAKNSAELTNLKTLSLPYCCRWRKNHTKKPTHEGQASPARRDSECKYKVLPRAWTPASQGWCTRKGRAGAQGGIN